MRTHKIINLLGRRTDHGTGANLQTIGGKKMQIQRQIEKTDKEIDGLVYKLYGITEKEREIIEEKV